MVSLLPLIAILTQPVSAVAAGAAPPATFESVSRQAQAAREAGRDVEAIDAYRAAVALRPEWDEGLWYLGTLLYQSGRCAEADAAFARFLQLKPQAGPGWVLRGLCSFERGEYPSAIDWLQRGAGLGLGGNVELQKASASRLSLALVKTGQFERAIQPLTLLSRLASDSPDLVSGTGLALLRLDLLPSEVPQDRRDLVQKLGRAGALQLARKGEEAGRAFGEVVAAYPDEPGVRYAYGVFLLRSGDEKGLGELRRAAELRPDDLLTHLEIAFELLARGDAAAARDAAARAVALRPTFFASRVALGRALVELGQMEAGVDELEYAVRLAPESHETHFALAQAYAKAGRAEDAARERAKFAEIEQRGRGGPASGSSRP